ncbi:MAG: hypothetical protein HOC70_14055 [Gammaproteobacteria bacterium]|jgi:hypothetical protein|nr:hypothetical protein [Gammaproteobacteria bacterium]MBT4494361.1 hypothetical protein [Gammaproteobacteria bacterium]MBT7371946.1 hypothetical protein [Gammaproteobacteria bacterium]
MTVEVVTEEDAPPLVRVFANRFRLSLQRPQSQDLVSSLETVFSLKSTKNAQAVTITVSKGKLELTHGVAPNSDIVVSMDFDNPKASTHMSGQWRHPFAAYRVGKLLSLPLPNWADSAKRFWAMTCNEPNVPAKVTITCTDEDRSLSFGEGETATEIIGRSAVLEDVLAGNTLMLHLVIGGKLRYRGTMEHLAGLSQAGQKIMLGELHG